MDLLLLGQNQEHRQEQQEQCLWLLNKEKLMGTSAITGINLGVPGYQQDFTSGPTFVVSHNLNSQFVDVTVYNDSDQIVTPDEVTATDANTATVDMTSFGTLTPTYRVVVIDKGATVNNTAIATDLNLSGQVAEDFAVFDGTNWIAQGGSELVKTGFFSRDISIATGTQIVTGIGFKPKSIFAFSAISASQRASWGLDDGVSPRGINDDSGTSADNYTNTGNLVSMVITPSDIYEGQISSFDADGFTISWLKIGSPTGTVSVNFMAFR
jgi:hypothetical protein